MESPSYPSGPLEEKKLTSPSHGQPLIQLDPRAESRLRRKLDLMVVPMVALLYLFASIDRSNIGAYSGCQILALARIKSCLTNLDHGSRQCPSGRL